MQGYSYVHTTVSFSENHRSASSIWFSLWQEDNIIKVSTPSLHLVEILQFVQGLPMSEEDVRDHLTYTIISSENKIRIYGFIMTQHS